MEGNSVLGYSCCAIAGVGFGINYLPVKGVDTGDGIFFSAVMSVGILAVGVFTGMALSSPPGLEMPKFEPLAAVGGVLWMCGNLMCPVIIQRIGLGLGLTVWDLSNMIMGWLTGKFGLFGVNRDVDQNPPLNCLGVSLASVSLIFFSLAVHCDQGAPGQPAVKEPGSVAKLPKNTQADLGCANISEVPTRSSMASVDSDIDDCEGQVVNTPKAAELEREADEAASERASARKGSCSLAVSILMALLTGAFFGTTFNLPTDLAQGNFGEEHSHQIMDYVFSHFCGIFSIALVALIAYVAVRGQARYTPRKMVLPAVASGVLWGIAQVAWFQANEDLGFSVSFPIITSLPGVVALLVGMCFFGEVRTRRSRLWAALGLAARIPGIILIAISD